MEMCMGESSIVWVIAACLGFFFAGGATLFVLGRFLSIFTPRPMQSQHRSVVESIKEVGDLVALAAVFKDVGSHTDQQSWWVSQRKLLVICEFEMQYRFDLRRVTVEHRGQQQVVRLPPCHIKTFYKDIMFYDEQEGRVLHWVPVIESILPRLRISVEERNEFIAKAKENAQKAARGDDAALLAKAEDFAIKTLQSLIRALDLDGDVVVEAAPREQTVREEEDQTELAKA
jgi:hypothetical protein